MATTAAAKDASPYEGGGGGAGGKFRKRPFRRPQSTPYDRPPTALRNLTTTTNSNGNNGWISKLLDPASKLITASAHRLFASVFRKRLPPPPPPPQPHTPVSEAQKEATDKLYEAHSNANRPQENLPGLQQQNINEGENPSNNSDSNGFTELEQILNQKTFTRSEIERLTSLLHSITLGMLAPHAENRFEANSAPAAHDIAGPAKSPMQENGIQSRKLHGIVSTPILSSRVEEDVASPSELAKVYMGSRSSKVSPSMLGLRSQAFREGSPLLSNVPFTPKSPIMSLVSNVRVPESVAMTPRSRGRSAINSMARTPYSRILPASSHKGSVTKFDAFGGPSSSSQCRLERNRLSSSNQAALKRGSYVLDNDIGSIGPIRRIRQKPNLLSSKSLSLPASGSPLSGTGVVSRLQSQNGATTCFAPIPSQSSEMAQKILQQLDKLVPAKDKSSELKVAFERQEPPTMLTSDMLNGQAHRSLEDADFSRFLENVQDNKFDGSSKTSLPDARGSTSQKQDKVEENGPTKVMDKIGRSDHAVNGLETSVLKRDSTPITKSADFAISNAAGHPPSQKKQAFQMSAHEEYLDLDDDGYTNGTASNSLSEVRGNLDTALVVSKSSFLEPVKLKRPPGSSESRPLTNSILNKNADPETFKGTTLAEKSTVFAFSVAPAISMTIQPAVPYPGSNSEANQVQPRETNNASPIFNFSSNNVDKVSPAESSSTSIVGDFKGIKPGASLDQKLESSSSPVFVAAGAAASTLKVPESDKVDKSTQMDGDIFRKPESVLPSAASTSTSTSTSSTSFFSFGSPANKFSVNNGSLSSSPSTLSSLAPVSIFNNSSTQNLSNSSTVFASDTITPDTTTTSGSSNLSTFSVFPSFPAATISGFGSSVFPSTSAPVSSGIESSDTQVKNKHETTFDNLSSNPYGATASVNGNTGSNIFGLSASATSSVTNQSLGSNPFGTAIGSLASTQASVGTGRANFTHSTPVQFGSSSSTPTFGLIGTTAVASGSSPFGSSTPASTARPFSSGASFGLSSSVTSSEANPVSSSNGPTTIFGSTCQPSKSPIFGSTSNSTAPSTVFSFGASSASVAAPNNTSMVVGSPPGTSTGALFSFTLSAANTSSSASLTPSQPVFGNLNPAFIFGSGSGNNDQISMEDTMAEDTIQASTPTVSNFGQPPNSSPSSGFMFNLITPSGANPFQFGSLQNPATIQNPSQATLGANPFQFGNQQSSAAPNQSPFQASGSLDFNAGGSFSLGTGGGDKSSRRMVKVKRTARKK